MNLPSVVANIASELSKIVPEPIQVTSDGLVIQLSIGEKTWSRTDMGRLVYQSGNRLKNLEIAGYSVLDHVQDFVSEEATEPWPPSPPPAQPGRRSFAMPGVAVKDGQLRLWYGDPEAPVLSIPPIDLEDEP